MGESKVRRQKAAVAELQKGYSGEVDTLNDVVPSNEANGKNTRTYTELEIARMVFEKVGAKHVCRICPMGNFIWMVTSKAGDMVSGSSRYGYMRSLGYIYNKLRGEGPASDEDVDAMMKAREHVTKTAED